MNVDLSRLMICAGGQWDPLSGRGAVAGALAPNQQRRHQGLQLTLTSLPRPDHHSVLPFQYVFNQLHSHRTLTKQALC